MSIKNKIVVSSAIALAFVIGVALTILVVNAVKEKTVEVLGSMANAKCNVSSTGTSTIGHQVSRTLLAANENRAWAIIEQPANASNTAHISFDEGAAAVVGGGWWTLTPATTTSPLSKTEAFGRATMFPYTGEVTGITNTSSSTVIITECSY